MILERSFGAHALTAMGVEVVGAEVGRLLFVMIAMNWIMAPSENN